MEAMLNFIPLFPAYAGVIPSSILWAKWRKPFPRTRGGDLKGKRRMVFLPGETGDGPESRGG